MPFFIWNTVLSCNFCCLFMTVPSTLRKWMNVCVCACVRVTTGCCWSDVVESSGVCLSVCIRRPVQACTSLESWHRPFGAHKVWCVSIAVCVCVCLCLSVCLFVCLSVRMCLFVCCHHGCLIRPWISCHFLLRNSDQCLMFHDSGWFCFILLLFGVWIFSSSILVQIASCVFALWLSKYCMTTYAESVRGDCGCRIVVCLWQFLQPWENEWMCVFVCVCAYCGKFFRKAVFFHLK